jgi:hypothetical protein
MDKIMLESSVGKNTTIFSIYGYFIGSCIFLLFINYGVFHKNLLLEFLDIFFAIINIVIVCLFLKKIFSLKNEIKTNDSIFAESKKFNNIYISILFILFILFVGIFLLIYFKDKSIYIFTVYSLGISFIFQSLLLIYFLLIRIKGEKI